MDPRLPGVTNGGLHFYGWAAGPWVVSQFEFVAASLPRHVAARSRLYIKLRHYRPMTSRICKRKRYACDSLKSSRLAVAPFGISSLTNHRSFPAFK
jgi:hypothetical protein